MQLTALAQITCTHLHTRAQWCMESGLLLRVLENPTSLSYTHTHTHALETSPKIGPELWEASCSLEERKARGISFRLGTRSPRSNPPSPHSPPG